MIVNSTAFMTVIDLATVAFTVAAAFVFFRNFRRISTTGNWRGFAFIAVGLLIMASFYLADLLSMHLLPAFISRDSAAIFRENLQHTYVWLILSGGLGLVSVGILMNSRRIFDLLETVSMTRTALEQEQSDKSQAQDLSLRLGTIVEDSINEIYVFDAGTLKFQMVNRGARSNLGFTMEELSALTPVNIKPEFTETKFLELLAPLKSGARSRLQFETVHQRKDGSLYDVSVNLHLTGEKGSGAFFAVIEDITERKQAVKLLQQAQKMEAVGQLSGGIAHDFNNLLLVIQGNLEMLREGGAKQKNFDRTIDILERAAKRGSDLTTRLLAFARRQPLAPEKVNVNILTKSMTEMLARILGEQIEIETVLAGGLWSAVVDPAQLENAIVNLAINARDAMPDGGKLTIETSNSHLDDAYAEVNAEVEAGQYVLLAISDTGEGMTPEVMDRAFEPFFTTRPVGEGSGLGLSMVYGFVKQSGGHVKLYSEGEGTTVKLYLPRTRRHTQAVPEKRADDNKMPGGQETILVVEDDDEVREFVVGTLGDLGYRVIEAGCGVEALERLGDIEEFDLLLTDVVLPGGLNGRQTAEEMIRQRPGLKVLYTSGYSANAIIHHGKLDADVDFLAKPYKRRDLARKVRLILDRD